MIELLNDNNNNNKLEITISSIFINYIYITHKIQKKQWPRLSYLYDPPARDPGGHLQIIFCRKVEGFEIRKRLEVDGQDALIAHKTDGAAC